MIPALPPTHEQTIAAISACGVSAANIRVAYEDELQSDVVTISDLEGTGEERLRCVRRAIHPSYILQIEDMAQRSAYYSLTDREDRQEAKAEAIAWLQSMEMLDRVPPFDPARGLEIFARALEAACGLPPGSAREVFDDDSILTFRRGFFEGLTDDRYEELTCLSRMIAASNADEYDIRLVLIGNEVRSEDRR